MALQCSHYNYKNSDPCSGTFDHCAKQVDCPKETGHHCFVVWQAGATNNTVISAGCNPPYQSAPDEKCGSECIGQPRGVRFYCCCTGNLCNKHFKVPTPQYNKQTLDTLETHLEARETTSFLWPVIFVLLLITLIGAFIWRKHRRPNGDSCNQNARNKASPGDLNIEEMNELRINQNLPVMVPFNRSFGDSRFFNNNNDPNHHDPNNMTTSVDNQNSIIMTNHNDASHNYINGSSDNMKIDLKSVDLLEVIGSGRFGTVYRACLHRSYSVAVKVILPTEHQSWLNEQQIYTLPNIKHVNILNFLHSDVHVESGNYWLIVEYASKGSLHDFLKDNVVSWEELTQIALGIVHGLAHLHEADIAHRDFKSKNVLLRHDLSPCITDFGVASLLDTRTGSQMDRKKYLQVGTPRYMAPEVLECSVTFTKSSFTKVDVYALSLVLWELLSRCHPLPKLTQNGSAFNNNSSYIPAASSQLNGQGDQLDDHLPPPYSGDCDEKLKDQQRQQQQQRNQPEISLQGDRNEGVQEQARVAEPVQDRSSELPAYQLPFQEVAGPNPDINRMLQIVVTERLRPPLKDEWRCTYPISDFCRAIEDGWEYDYDARISASCFVERVEVLPRSIESLAETSFTPLI